MPSRAEEPPADSGHATTVRHRRALLCLVTDRRRLGAALGRPAGEWDAVLLRQIEGAVAGGIDLVQVRERDLEAGALAALLREAVRIAKGSAARVVVNDRADVAIVAGAAGVHLREASVPAAAIRRIAPGLFVGRSVHGPAAAARAAADYLVAGTVFSTTSKGKPQAVLGVTRLADIVHEAASTPVLAIGGITEARVEDVVRAGAAGMAGIGAFIPSGSSHVVAPDVAKLVKRLRFAFDSA